MAIEHISDTARWVAMYRAWETERPDAIFRDPYARRLAGARGEAIVRAIPGGRQMAWSMIVRTALYDELIQRLVERERVDVVLHLASGLDTRPYRLPLPSSLQWIEVDLPSLIAEKERELAGETPVCRVTREPVDLADEGARRALFARVGALGGRVLVVTEGLLVYLRPEQVAALARDLRAQPSFRWWLTEISGPRVLEYLKRRAGRILDAANATMHFAPAEGEEFFRPLGWTPVEFREFLVEARRLKREMPLMWLWRPLMAVMGALSSRERQERERRAWRSGVVLLEATSAPAI